MLSSPPDIRAAPLGPALASSHRKHCRAIPGRISKLAGRTTQRTRATAASMAREQNIACFRKSFHMRLSGFIAMVSGNRAARITFAIATLDTGQQRHINPILLAQAVHRGRLDRQFECRWLATLTGPLWVEPKVCIVASQSFKHANLQTSYLAYSAWRRGGLSRCHPPF
jgi:hypothetical protein